MYIYTDSCWERKMSVAPAHQIDEQIPPNWENTTWFEALEVNHFMRNICDNRSIISYIYIVCVCVYSNQPTFSLSAHTPLLLFLLLVFFRKGSTKHTFPPVLIGKSWDSAIISLFYELIKNVKQQIRERKKKGNFKHQIGPKIDTSTSQICSKVQKKNKNKKLSSSHGHINCDRSDLNSPWCQKPQ